MATDYGDEAGEKLFDWMLRVGQDAGVEAMEKSIERLRNAIKKVRGNVAGNDLERADEHDAHQYVKLNLSEFKEIPDYATIKQIIDEKLSFAAIEHDFTDIDGREYLVFPIKDTPEVDSVFEGLEKDIDSAHMKTKDDLSYDKDIEHAGKRDQEVGIERDEEPLEDKAQAAKVASKAMSEAREATRNIERTDGMSR